ncbi:MAG: mechanosensitive ion channel family protein [Vicinamibacteria bacterium]|jgi:MscS family membrane protein|nr:mechanosensitive ion channel family protein [Vicinamibacteria bacterium]
MRRALSGSPVLLSAALVAACAATAAAQAQPETTPLPAAEEAQTETVVAEDSPRAAVAAYLDLCRAGRYADAARFLKAPPERDAALLAERLKAVLDRHLWIDLDALSPEAGGRGDDGLAPDVDELGRVPGAGGRPEPVRLVRLEDRWAFSSGTVARIDGWYERLADRWLRERLPGFLLRPGPHDLLWWQWLALVCIAAISWGAGRALGRLTRTLLGRAFARTSTTWDDVLLERLAAPLTLGWALLVGALASPALALYAPAQAFLVSTLGAIGVLVLFWALWRAVDVVGAALSASEWATENASARSLLSLGVRTGKVAVAAAGLVAALSQLGYPAASLVAGLGLGGLAFALAAQKTVEHFFGSVALVADQPFRVGDFVKVEDFVGTVEAIGLRSTRFRTLDRTLISIPNGRLADQRLESFAARDRLRLACTVGLEYGTTAAQMRQVLEGLERALREHPKIWPDAVIVRFKEFAACSLDIEVMCWFQTSEWSEFQLIRQEVLLQFMQVVEAAGCAFAFPTRTVHLVGPTPAG